MQRAFGLEGDAFGRSRSQRNPGACKRRISDYAASARSDAGGADPPNGLQVFPLKDHDGFFPPQGEAPEFRARESTHRPLEVTDAPPKE